MTFFASPRDGRSWCEVFRGGQIHLFLFSSSEQMYIILLKKRMIEYLPGLVLTCFSCILKYTPSLHCLRRVKTVFPSISSFSQESKQQSLYVIQLHTSFRGGVLGSCLKVIPFYGISFCFSFSEAHIPSLCSSVHSFLTHTLELRDRCLFPRMVLDLFPSQL